MHGRAETNAIHQLLEDERIHSIQVKDQTRYSAADLTAVLTGCVDGQAEWEELKHVEPSLRSRSARAEVGGGTQDVLNLAGVMRLIQAIDSPKAERVRSWLADVAARHLEEEADPELAIQRLRQSYAGQGRTRQWIDQRLRSISARQELVGEWHRRGVKESDQFRLLTNKLMEATFGMDVNALRQSKGYNRDLRDHLSDLELSLLSLAEATAASLHRHRHSSGVDQLLRDIDDAGRIVSQTQHRIAQATAGIPGEMAA